MQNLPNPWHGCTAWGRIGGFFYSSLLNFSMVWVANLVPSPRLSMSHGRLELISLPSATDRAPQGLDSRRSLDGFSLTVSLTILLVVLGSLYTFCVHPQSGPTHTCFFYGRTVASASECLTCDPRYIHVCGAGRCWEDQMSVR